MALLNSSIMLTHTPHVQVKVYVLLTVYPLVVQCVEVPDNTTSPEYKAVRVLLVIGCDRLLTSTAFGYPPCCIDKHRWVVYFVLARCGQLTVAYFHSQCQLRFQLFC